MKSSVVTPFPLTSCIPLTSCPLKSWSTVFLRGTAMKLSPTSYWPWMATASTSKRARLTLPTSKEQHLKPTQLPGPSGKGTWKINPRLAWKTTVWQTRKCWRLQQMFTSQWKPSSKCSGAIHVSWPCQRCTSSLASMGICYLWTRPTMGWSSLGSKSTGTGVFTLM